MRGKPGYYRLQSGKTVHTDSKLERRRIGVLERAGFVVERETIRIPFVYRGRRRIFRPDLVVKSRSGRVAWVEEDKPTIRLGDPLNRAKFEAARLWCARRGLVFRVVTEREAGRP